MVFITSLKHPSVSLKVRYQGGERRPSLVKPFYTSYLSSLYNPLQYVYTRFILSFDTARGLYIHIYSTAKGCNTYPELNTFMVTYIIDLRTLWILEVCGLGSLTQR